MKKTFFLVVLSASLFACSYSSKEEQTTESEPKVIRADNFSMMSNLTGEQILDSYHHNHLGIDVTDSLLVLTVLKDTVHHYVYGKHSLQKLGAVGAVGKGPQEWAYVFHSNQYVKEADGIHLWFYRFDQGDLMKVNLTKTLATGSAKPVITERIEIEAKKFPFIHLFYVNDEKIIGTSGYFETERVRLKSYNPQTGEVQKSGLFPTIANANKLRAESTYNIYNGRIRKHPSKNLYVQAMGLFNRIDFFDENLNLLRSAVAGKNWDNNYLDGANELLINNVTTEFEDGYGETAVGESFIYAVDIPKIKSERSGRVETTQIKVFNWNAEPQCILYVTGDISGLAVDEAEGYLYTVDHKNEKVIRYNIKMQLEKWKK